MSENISETAPNTSDHVPHLHFKILGVKFNKKTPTNDNDQPQPLMGEMKFWPGQIVTGSVDIEVCDSAHSSSHMPHLHLPSYLHGSNDDSSRPIEHNQMLLRIDGHGRAEWRVAGENGGKAQMHEHFLCDEKVIQVPTSSQLGKHSLPFEFEIPDE